MDDLRRATRYAQPTVQNAVMELSKRGWLKSRTGANPRPWLESFAYKARPSEAALTRHYKAMWQGRLDVVLTALTR